jgi:hypothetical protein
MPWGTLVHTWPLMTWIGRSAVTRVPVTSASPGLPRVSAENTSSTSPRSSLTTPVPSAATPPPASTSLPVSEGSSSTVVSSSLAVTV